MERDPERDKRKGEVKIEDRYLRLPKNLLKPGSDPTDDLCYMKIFEDDNHKAKHISEAVALGAQADRKVYRIRNKDLAKVLGMDDEVLKHIHRVSKATIGILADAETNHHRHSYLDLLGTVDEVKTAEELILDEILKTYGRILYPVVLMPPTIYHHQMNIPFFKVARLIGICRNNILKMEMVSGTWIKIDPVHPPAGGSEWERVVYIYGPRQHVFKAMCLIHSIICEQHGESSQAQSEMEQEFKEAASDETKKEEQQQVEEGEGKGSAETEKEIKVGHEETGAGEEAERKQSE